MEGKLTLEGFKELDALLKMMPDDVAKKTLESATRGALKPVLNDAKALAPFKSGQLKDSLSIKKFKASFTKYGTVTFDVGANLKRGKKAKTAPHAHLVEFGTVKMAARPFLRPAWENNKDVILDYLRVELWKGIQRSAKKLAK